MKFLEGLLGTRGGRAMVYVGGIVLILAALTLLVRLFVSIGQVDVVRNYGDPPN